MDVEKGNSVVCPPLPDNNKERIRPAGQLFLLLVIMFASSACVSYYPLWHNEQRICQLLLVFSTALLAWVLPQSRLPKLGFWMLFAILTLGAVSASLSALPLWSFIEWTSYAGLLLVALVVGGGCTNRRFLLCLLYTMAVVAAVNSLQFLLRYQAALLYDTSRLTPLGLMTGFSNIRFLNQFQVLVMPLLAFMVSTKWRGSPRPHKAASLFWLLVLSVQWCLALLLGGRGMFTALLLAHAALLCLARRHWRLVLFQLIAACIGLLLFGFLFFVLPVLLDVSPQIHATFREGLSGRGVIWSLAWQMFVAHPVLGAGPMMFSAHINQVAAHPHQVVLQWFAEWGLPATLLAITLAAWGMWQGIRCLRLPQSASLDAALWLAIAAALALAQVDGVFVMPYTQTWLAILVGLALGRWRLVADMGVNLQVLTWRALVIPVLIIFGVVLTQQLPHLLVREIATVEQASVEGRIMPRFWIPGWVPQALPAAAPSKSHNRRSSDAGQ